MDTVKPLTKPAASLIAELRNGGCSSDFNDAMQQATAAVKETGKAAKVVLEITINPFDAEATDVERVDVTDKITCKLPVLKKRASVFFIGANNQLLRQPEIEGVVNPAPAAKTA
jgi:hypothetical protein